MNTRCGSEPLTSHAVHIDVDREKYVFARNKHTMLFNIASFLGSYQEWEAIEKHWPNTTLIKQRLYFFWNKHHSDEAKNLLLQQRSGIRKTKCIRSAGIIWKNGGGALWKDLPSLHENIEKDMLLQLIENNVSSAWIKICDNEHSEHHREGSTASVQWQGHFWALRHSKRWADSNAVSQSLLCLWWHGRIHPSSSASRHPACCKAKHSQHQFLYPCFVADSWQGLKHWTQSLLTHMCTQNAGTCWSSLSTMSMSLLLDIVWCRVLLRLELFIAHLCCRLLPRDWMQVWIMAARNIIRRNAQDTCILAFHICLKWTR